MKLGFFFSTEYAGIGLKELGPSSQFGKWSAMHFLRHRWRQLAYTTLHSSLHYSALLAVMVQWVIRSSQTGLDPVSLFHLTFPRFPRACKIGTWCGQTQHPFPGIHLLNLLTLALFLIYCLTKHSDEGDLRARGFHNSKGDSTWPSWWESSNRQASMALEL